MKKIAAALVTSMMLGMGTANVSAASHKVEKGDTLWEIAKKNNITVKQLMERNNLTSHMIYPKQNLTIDGDKNDQNNNNKDRYHKVEAGETLSSIAKKYDLRVKDLKDWNGLKTDLILSGQQLLLHSEKIQASKTVASNDTQTETKNTMTMKATAYTAKCEGCTGITATGIDLNKNKDAKVIAVDPKVIPLGSKVHVEGYGEAIAGDVGGAIKGNRIDVHLPTNKEANEWGVREVKVSIIN